MKTDSKPEIALSPAINAALDVDGGASLVLFSCADPKFIESAFIDLARTYMFEFSADAAALIGKKNVFTHDETYSHAPGKSDPLNSAVYSRDDEAGVATAIKSCLRMDTGCLLINAPVEGDAFNICLQAVVTGAKVFIAESSGSESGAKEFLKSRIAQDENPKMMDMILAQTKTKIFVRDEFGKEVTLNV